AINQHVAPAGEAGQVDAVAASLHEQLEAVVDQSFLVHSPGHAEFIEQVGGDLLENAGADAAQHVIAALALEDDVVDAGLVQQLAEQQASGACTDDGYLGSHACDSAPRGRCRPWHSRHGIGLFAGLLPTIRTCPASVPAARFLPMRCMARRPSAWPDLRCTSRPSNRAVRATTGRSRRIVTTCCTR